MNSGGLFGISVTRNRMESPIENILELEYDEHIEAWMPTAIMHAQKEAGDLSEEVLECLKTIGVADPFEWVLHRNAVERLLAADDFTASGYAHLIMRHRNTMYGILRWYDDVFTSFQELTTSNRGIALGIMSAALKKIDFDSGRKLTV